MHCTKTLVNLWTSLTVWVGTHPKSQQVQQLLSVQTKTATAYKDVRVARVRWRMAVDNAFVWNLGNDNRGIPAENHHVAPVHPEYADIGKPKFDPAGALALMKEAGMEDFEHELISIDARLPQRHHRCRCQPIAFCGYQGEAYRYAGFNILERLGEIPILIHELEPPPIGRSGFGSCVPWRREMERSSV